jgi:hypothetical protein
MTTRLDDQTADRLLGGLVAPEDAPPGFAAIAVLVRAARGPATDEELTAVPFAAPARAPRTAGGPSPVAPFGSPRRRRGGVTVRVALVVAVIGCGTTAAAASQGKLPDPVQRAVSTVAGHVGWQVPSPDDPAPPSTIESGEVPGPTGAVDPPRASTTTASAAGRDASATNVAPGSPADAAPGHSTAGQPAQGDSTSATAGANTVSGSSAVGSPSSPAPSEAGPPDTTAEAGTAGGAATTIAGAEGNPNPPEGSPPTTAADGRQGNGQEKDPSKFGNPTPGVPPTAPPGNGDANGFGNGNANGKTKP